MDYLQQVLMFQIILGIMLILVWQKEFQQLLTNSSYNYDERRLSYFARVQYDYKGKYLFSAMLRRDSSTKFGPDNRIGYFPSFTAGWVVSEEDFFGEIRIF